MSLDALRFSSDVDFLKTNEDEIQLEYEVAEISNIHLVLD